METSRELAVCGTDPFKLHYAWSLWRIGEMDHSVWRHEAAAARLAFEQGKLGFADLYLVEIPGGGELLVGWPAAGPGRLFSLPGVVAGYWLVAERRRRLSAPPTWRVHGGGRLSALRVSGIFGYG